ncbi:MAG: hypothetical protein ACLRZ6_15090 [Lachnospiraceae bacterium]
MAATKTSAFETASEKQTEETKKKQLKRQEGNKNETRQKKKLKVRPRQIQTES